MSAALDALLAELTPPPVPAGLAERIAAAVQATAQESHAGRARRAAARRDRRGRWRRGLVIGAGAVGLAFSGAVAASLAGVHLPAKVEAVIAKLPLIGREAPAQAAPAPRPRPVERAGAPAALPPEAAPKPVVDAMRMHELRQMRRLAAAREIVEARRAAGLPTPRADRMERRIQRRAEWWQQASPEQRQRFLEMRRQRQEARRERIEARRAAGIAPPPNGPPAPAARMERAEARPPIAGPVNRPVYGPVDPRTIRPPADGQQHRLRLREQRQERIRQQRLEGQGAPGTQGTATRPAPTATRPAPTTRPAPARRAPAPTGREGLRPTTR